MAKRLRPWTVLLTAVLAASGPRIMSSPAPEHPETGHGRRSETIAGSLPFLYDLYTFRGDTFTTVVATFAVQAGDLVREDVDGGVRYRFSVSLAVVDTVHFIVTHAHDSIFVEVARPLPRDHLLYTAVQVQAPPSDETIHRVIMFDAVTPGIGQLYRAPTPIPDYDGPDLMLSDIALAQPDAGIGWKRGDVTLPFLPTGRFPSSAFDAYYEIYNLPARNAYSTVITIERIDEAGAVLARVLDIRFAGESVAGSDAVVAERRRIESSLDRGRYRMTVTVTDLSTGQTASRSRNFEVHSTHGATMVPALNVSRGRFMTRR